MKPIYLIGGAAAVVLLAVLYTKRQQSQQGIVYVRQPGVNPQNGVAGIIGPSISLLGSFFGNVFSSPGTVNGGPAGTQSIPAQGTTSWLGGGSPSILNVGPGSGLTGDLDPSGTLGADLGSSLSPSQVYYDGSDFMSVDDGFGGMA